MGERLVWIIRHAESTWNVEGRWQGQADPPLSTRGRAQAELLAAALAAEELDLLMTSDLARAAQTATRIARRLGLVARPEPRLREIAAGDWSGRSHAQIRARDARALRRFLSGDRAARAGGGETRDEVGVRARAALRALLAEESARRIGVVTHQGVVRALLPQLELANAEWRVVPAAALLRSGGAA